MIPTHLDLQLPDWLCQQLTQPLPHWPDDAARMRWVLQLARRNAEARSGGPFAAAVFDGQGALVAAGVNLVEGSGLSCAHAEVVALSLAERRLASFELSRADLCLFSSAEPCSMCLGALHWAGIRRLIYSACDADVRAIGFDEGDKPPAWRQHMEQRGVRVEAGLVRDEGRAVLHRYHELGGLLYNAGNPEP